MLYHARHKQFPTIKRVHNSFQLGNFKRKNSLPLHLIIHTKLAPPRPPKHALHRARLLQTLHDANDYRLTILQANTGYGKSTLLGTWQPRFPTVWYNVDAEDAEPQRFLRYLLHGFAKTLPVFSDTPLVMLEEGNGADCTAVLTTLLNHLAGALKDNIFLILDDAHHLNQSSETLQLLDHLIRFAPSQLHIILATRYSLHLPNLLNWQLKGELQEIGQGQLTFTPLEIDTLFRQQYQYPLTLEQASLLVNKIEGWPIALHLIWQRLQRDGGATLPDILNQLSGSASDLFRYLTQELLTWQPPDVQAFLHETAVLRHFTVSNCDTIRQQNNSQALLDYLLEQGLFIIALGDGQMRYHHLFRELLYQQLKPQQAQTLHLRAAQDYQKRNQTEESLYHYLAAHAYPQAAQILSQWGQHLVRAGSLDTLSQWIGQMPPDVLTSQPALLSYLGDIARLRSQFDHALQWYEQAETEARAQNNITVMGQALRGQARVYLDTINPRQAEKLLQETLSLADKQADRASRAKLLDLLAENLLNQGRLQEAQTYQQQAHELRDEGPSAVELPVRMMLRTGRLQEARSLLEKQATQERQDPIQRPRAHRETLLLLSLILAAQGEQALAMATAVEGTKRGQQLQSDFVTAVGYMRQGHAWSLKKNKEGFIQAIKCHQEAIQISQALDVPRLKVEAHWGLCKAYGFQGDLDRAEQVAQEGIRIAQQAGDEWIAANIRVAMGASFVLGNKKELGITWLGQAYLSFQECADTYGQAISRLWQCIIWYKYKDQARLTHSLNELLTLCQKHHYPYLFQKRTLLGPPDPRILIPLLLVAREQHIALATVQTILDGLGLAGIESHPGYQLRVQTLGGFRVWRGQEELPHQTWTRKKARQLFQFLLTHGEQLHHKEQISDQLWPELPPEGATRDFKIAYSAMCNALETGRKRNSPSAYVVRRDVHYGLDPRADLWVDARVFCDWIAVGDKSETAVDRIHAYTQALALYKGDYLPNQVYADWCAPERERLRQLFVQTADQLAQLHVAQKEWETAVHICQQLLAQDNCWEPAYRLLMQAHMALGQRTQAIRVYQQAIKTLDKELGVPPSSETIALYESLINQTAVSA